MKFIKRPGILISFDLDSGSAENSITMIGLESTIEVQGQEVEQANSGTEHAILIVLGILI